MFWGAPRAVRGAEQRGAGPGSAGLCGAPRTALGGGGEDAGRAGARPGAALRPCGVPRQRGGREGEGLRISFLLFFLILMVSWAEGRIVTGSKAVWFCHRRGGGEKKALRKGRLFSVRGSDCYASAALPRQTRAHSARGRPCRRAVPFQPSKLPVPIFICQAGAGLALFQMCLTRFGADELFIALWFHCHGNRARGQGGWELFLDLCCNVKLIGKVSASSKPD